MDYQKIELIKQKLNANNYDHVSNKIDSLIASGSTGGEIVGLVGKYLLSLKRKNKPLKNIIGVEIDEFLKYAESIGLDID